MAEYVFFYMHVKDYAIEFVSSDARFVGAELYYEQISYGRETCTIQNK